MNIPRYGHMATLLPNGKVLVAGGGYNVGYFASAELYDPAIKTWTTTSSMANNRTLFTATLLSNGKVLVAGGLSSQGIYNSPLNAVEVYEATTGTWRVTGSLATGRYTHTATLLPNGKVLVAGGVNLNAGGYLASAELFDPVTETWANTSPMTVARTDHTATLLTNGMVLVAGGVGLASAELYNPVTGAWTPTGSMNYARRGHTATLLPNGQVLVVGGIGGSGSAAISSAETYDPVSGTWTPAGTMATARFDHAATLLPGGQVLVTGGGSRTGVNATNTTELYQPGTRAWVAGGWMSTARGAHTATLLADGSVLVAAGDNGVVELASAELYVKVPAVIFGNLVQVYSGTARYATYFTEPSGLPVNVTYDGSINAPTNVGSYTVAGVITDPNNPGGATNTLMIVKAQATVTLGQLAQTYNGTARSVSVSTTPLGLAIEVTYNGSTAPPTNAGGYTVIATVNDPNYQGQATNTLIITGPPIITAGPANQVVGKGGTVTLSLTAGGYPPPTYQWFKDSRRLWGATNSTLTVMNADVTYSGTYYAVASNAYGVAISLPARVAVGNPTLLAWGDNFYGQLGNGTKNNALIPVTIVSNVVAGAAGSYHSLFVKADGTLWAMGENDYGQLGNGTTTNAQVPILVANNTIAVAAGDLHSLFVKSSGTLWVMGRNYYGQLGNGKTSGTSPNPTPINVASNVVTVAAGQDHTLFVKTDGSLWAMGYNWAGQLGNGDPNGTNVLTPAYVTSNVVAVAAGSNFSLFVKADGTLWAMGYDAFGELGNGTNNANQQYKQLTPVKVASNVAAVAAGTAHSLFVKTNGTLWGMGFNNRGQLGNGDPTSTNVFSPVSVASNVVAVAAGCYHSLFTKTNGTLWGMGLNSEGELGDGTTNNANRPVNVPLFTVANLFPGSEAFHSLAAGIDYHATVTLGQLNQTYKGRGVRATASTMPPRLAVILTYNGSTTAPTNAGSYTVIGTVSDPNYVGSATNTLVINPAATATTLTNVMPGPFFPGQALTASYLVSPVPPVAGILTGTVVLTNELSAVTGPAPVGALTMVLTNPGTYHFGATYSGDTNFLPSSSSPVLARTVLSMTDPAAWSPGVVVSNGTRFLQTTLMQQLLTLSNVTSQTLAAVRVTVHLNAADLAAHIIVFNASGTNGAGEPYLQHNYSVPPGGRVTFTAEYFSPDRVTVPNPTFTVEWVVPELLVAPPGTIQAVLRPPVVLAPDSALLIDFLTVRGANYYILYKDDLSSTNWNVAQPPVAGTGYDVQWVDDGPPKTQSPPGSVPQRYYEVLKAN